MILACLKWVDTRPEINPLTGSSAPDARFSGAAAADLAALEWALRLADRLATTVTAVCCGPPQAEAMLRDALAAGAAQAILVAGTGVEASRTVAARLAPLGVEASLVCCGVHSLDRGSGSVPGFLAVELGIAQALGLVRVEPTPTDDRRAENVRFTVERRLDHGRRERLLITDRCVLSFEAGPELRRASLAATLTSRTTSIEHVSIDSTSSDSTSSNSTSSTEQDEPLLIERGPYRPRAKVKPPPVGETRERVDALLGTDDDHAGPSQRYELESQAAAELVVERLVGWGYLLPPTSESTSDPSPLEPDEP